MCKYFYTGLDDGLILEKQRGSSANLPRLICTDLVDRGLDTSGPLDLDPVAGNASGQLVAGGGAAADIRRRQRFRC